MGEEQVGDSHMYLVIQVNTYLDRMHFTHHCHHPIQTHRKVFLTSLRVEMQVFQFA